jgi:hypothetical protein
MISFLQFLKEQEDKISYVDALGDELGIDMESLYKDPKYASFFSIGPNGVNIGIYKVLEFKKNSEGKITHAVVILDNDKTIKNKKYHMDSEKDVQVSNFNAKNKFVIKIEDLESLMTQGSQPQQGAM